MAAKKTTALIFVLGVWLGSSILLLWVVGSSFPGVERAVVENNRLTAAAGFAPGQDAAKKVSVAWVVAGELNRQYFSGWNVGQLALAVCALVFASRSGPRGALLGLCGAGLIVLALTFWLAPEITTLGRSLDFVPREPPPAALESFNRLHGIYTALELVKVTLIALATWLSFNFLEAATGGEDPPQPVS